MVKHIVVYTLKEGVNKPEAIETIRSVLEPLVGVIPGLTHMEIRMAYQGGMDYALYSEFESPEALKNYVSHPAHLAATHEKLYRAMRKAQPELPIIMITMPKIVLNDDILQRKAVVRATYEKAVAEGDTKVRYIDGCEMIQCMGTDGGLVDNAHPNDLGFLCMAKVIGAAVKEFLDEA